MKISISIIYEDLNGSEKTNLVYTDDSESMLIRNVLFTQIEGEGFKPEITTTERELSSFKLWDGILGGFSIKHLENTPRKVHYRDQKYQKLNELLDQLDQNIPLNDQLDLLRQFNSITNEEIEILTTYSKDVEAAMALRHLGPYRVQHILPTLLSGVMDMNWPDSGEI